jgi:hypothetical protein
VRRTLTGMMVCEEYRPFARFADHAWRCFRTNLCLAHKLQDGSCARYEPSNPYRRDTATGGSNDKKRKPRVGVNQVSRCGIARGL